MKNKFYITTPIYYVNAKPHIGHAYTTIVADCLARFYRCEGAKVHFLTGTDEHGQKIQKAAAENKLDPIEFTDQIVQKFKELWKGLQISNDDFIRTTNEGHIKTVQDVLKIVYDKGDIYLDNYGGWYCVPCETFWMETQLENKLCPDCHRSVEYLEEKNYFFQLSKYQDWLMTYIKDHPDFIFPKSRYNEVLSFLENNKLNDLCISRPKARLSWGIPLPFDPDHVTYVWFDALINYISAIGFSDDKKRFNELWPADVQIMAKDILRQHAIYWPIMLKSLDLAMPKQVVVHGYWLMDEVKMSKSRGNVVNPLELVDQHGVDSFRYYLLRDMTFGEDGNFSVESFEKRYNGDLANDLGNLVYRTLSMVEKYVGTQLPKVEKMFIPAGIENEVLKNFIKDPASIQLLEYFSKFDFSSALDAIWDVVKAANKFVEQVKPWNLKKEGKTDEILNFLNIMVEVIRFTGEKISPFMPETSRLIQQQIGNGNIQKGNPLFQRLENPKKE